MSVGILAVPQYIWSLDLNQLELDFPDYDPCVVSASVLVPSGSDDHVVTYQLLCIRNGNGISCICMYPAGCPFLRLGRIIEEQIGQFAI